MRLPLRKRGPELASDLAERLHELRLRGMWEAPSDSISEALVRAGWARWRGRMLALTPEGRDAHAAWARVPPGSAAEDALARAYEAFLPLNAQFLELCSEWQVTPEGSPNDHRDPVYDERVVRRLSGIHKQVVGLIAGVAEHCPRFGRYRDQLAHARERLEAGERDWFTSPRLDSYHTVWMRLHEDLLCCLGLSRDSSEPPPPPPPPSLAPP